MLDRVKSTCFQVLKITRNKNLTDYLFKKFFVEWFFISIILAGVIIYYADPALQRQGYILYDSLVKVLVKKEQSSDSIVIVAIDDDSIDALGRWPWPRSYHSDLLSELQSAAPKVLAFNVLFTEAEDNKASSLSFREAIKDSVFPVVLPVLKTTQYADFYLKTHNTLLSTIDITADPDGVIRRVKLIDRDSNRLLPQLSLQAYWGADNNGLSIQSIYTQELINYSNTQDFGFKQVSYKDILSGNYEKEDFANKIVLVGMTATGLGDRFVTPLSNSHSSVNIHAEIIRNILNDSFFYDLNNSERNYVSLFIVFLYFITVFFVQKIHMSYVVLAFSFIVVYLTITLLYFNIWWSPLSCIAIFLVSWMIWSWRRSVAIISWCRSSLRYSTAYTLSDVGVSTFKIKKPIVYDRFQFELNYLERMLNSAKNLDNKKAKLRTFLSHDLRTPHASMMALIGSQKNSKTALPEHDFNLHMERLIHKSLSLLDDLLVLSKSEIDLLKLQPVLLAAVVQDTLDYLWPQLTANNIKVSFTTQDNELGEILGDAKLLLRAFANILENSIKYAGAGATILINLKKDQSGIVLSLSDDGPGLNNSNNYSGVDSHTLHSVEFINKSYGLGLELVKTAVSLHNAKFLTSDLKGKGAEFVLIFPIPENLDD